MQPYNNSRGGSNIISYEIGNDFIIVQFKDFKKYKYSYQSAGQSNVEYMKQLAIQGSGLNSFINSRVKKQYER
ncbi:MAG: hypothetical protein WC822_01780 [Candidatus Paceibacterota bacterium]|jgi:hypothetical protein